MSGFITLTGDSTMDKNFEVLLEYIFKRKSPAKLTNSQIVTELYKYGEYRFYELPEWLKVEVRNRKLSFGPREPDPIEILESKNDGRLHKYYNKQLSTEDLHNHYARGDYYDIRC